MANRLLFLAVTGALMLVVQATLAGKPGEVVAANCAERPAESACDSELDALCAALEAAESLNARTMDSMVSKVIGATLKINQGKFEEAALKLYQIEETLNVRAQRAQTQNQRGRLQLCFRCFDVRTVVH